MSKFNDLQRETKALLKSLITSDTSQETLEKLTTIDKQLDTMRESHEEVLKENTEIKDKFFDMVKTTSFKVETGEEFTDGEQAPQDLDSIIAKSINDISKEK